MLDADTSQDLASDAPPEELNRTVWRRESALLIVLAVVCNTLENLVFAPKIVDRHQFARALPLLAIAIGLTSMVPSALRVNPRLGLPGAPLVAAKIGGERLHFRISSLLKLSAGYAFLNLVVSAAVLMIVVGPTILAHPNVKFPVPPLMKLAPGRIAIGGALLAVAAGIGEEIQFRLVLFAVFASLARLITRGSSRPSRGALWVATILQAYAFGMVHQDQLAHLVHLIRWSPTTPALLVGGLLMPQTWGGVVLGRLYLRRGLEASMLAHVMIDGALFALLAIIAAIGVLLAHLGAG